MLLWDFLTRVMQGVTMAFFEDVWSRNFLNYFATPLRTSEYLTGLVLAAVGTSMISLIVMVVFARAAFGLSFLSYGLALAPFLVVLFLTGIALGVAAAALGLRLGPASEWLIWPIPTLISPFAGVFYPVTILPGWMQAIAALLPPSYVFEGMRAVVAGEPAPWDRLALGGGLAMIYLVSRACSSRRSIAPRSAPASSPATAPRRRAEVRPSARAHKRCRKNPESTIAQSDHGPRPHPGQCKHPNIRQFHDTICRRGAGQIPLDRQAPMHHSHFDPGDFKH